LAQRFSLARLFAGALAVVLAVGAPVGAFAVDDLDDHDPGKLNLNTTVLVNESVGGGSTGDFAIRGSLFSDRLIATADELRARASARLNVVDTLDFAPSDVSSIDFAPVRAGLFNGYTSRDVPQAARDDEQASPVFLGAAAVAAVPLMLLAGVLLGRYWGRRKKATS
jgi:hypothetical protein